jgi:hypothetical protein
VSKLLGWLCFAGLLLTASTGRAADSCDAVLIPSKFTDYNNTKLQVQLLKLINRDNFTAVSNKIGGKVTGPIDEIPVDFGANYDSFSQQRDKVFQKETLDIKDEQVRSIASTYLPPEIANAWSECMKNKQAGLILEPRYSSDTSLLVTEFGSQQQEWAISKLQRLSSLEAHKMAYPRPGLLMGLRISISPAKLVKSSS